MSVLDEKANAEQSSVTVSEAAVTSVLARLEEVAAARGLDEAERAEVLAMVTPNPEHVVAA